MDDIKEMRSEIDAIDASLAQLYRQRMEAARRIGRFKLEHNLPVDDPQREAQLLMRARRSLSRSCVRALNGCCGSLYAQASAASARKRIFAQGMP